MNRSTSVSPCWCRPASVLSSTVSAPAARACRVMWPMSAIRVTGLVGLSKITRRVGVLFSTRSIPASSSIDSMVWRTPKRCSVRLSSVRVGCVGLHETKHVVTSLSRPSSVCAMAPTPDAQTMASSRPCNPAIVCFKLPRRRIGGARIEKAFLFAPQAAQGVGHGVVLELDALVDRRYQGPVVLRRQRLRRVDQSGLVLHAASVSPHCPQPFDPRRKRGILLGEAQSEQRVLDRLAIEGRQRYRSHPALLQHRVAAAASSRPPATHRQRSRSA